MDQAIGRNQFGHRLLWAAMCLLLVCACMLALRGEAHANIASGTSGTCSWVIDDDGVLTIRPTDGVSGTLLSSTGTNNLSMTVRWYIRRTSVTKVVVNPGVKTAAGAAGLFYGMSNCTEMDLSNLDTSAATNMSSMFYNCSSLASLDLSSWDTGNVTSMSSMFYNCSNLVSLNVSGWDTSSVTDMGSMFIRCVNLASLDLSSWDTGNVTSMNSMFFNCSNLVSLNVSGWDTSSVTGMSYMFSGCSSLKSLDLFTWTINSTTSMGTTRPIPMYDIFKGCSSLEEIQLGPKFKFGRTANDYYLEVLPTPPTTAPYTGRWVHERGGTAYTPSNLSSAYNRSPTSMAGTWVWYIPPTEYTLVFAPGEGVGNMPPQKIVAAEDGVISPNTFILFNHTFDHWEASDGNTYADGATIPANTYWAGNTITLTAVFTKDEHSAQMEGNEFEITLHGGETAYIPGIDSSSAYQVWEETPTGWVLVDQSGTAGDVEPLTIAKAAFTNDYQPGTATATVVATKLMDGSAAAAGAFTFQLWEGSTLVETVTNGAAGFVQFAPLTYTAIGEHTYTIREVAGSDATVTYDGHEETVTVTVTKDDSENFVASVAYDDNGAVFQNYTKPGSLTLAKTGVGVTEANADTEFTFKVTFRQANGLPIDEDAIQWYVVP